MNLVELKKYPFEEAVYIQVFGIPKKELESRPLNELITDYDHLRENVEEAIQILPEREQMILRQVLDQKMTLRAVGNECGVTPTQTGRILFKAIRRLQYFPGRHILDGTRRQKRIEANAEEKRKTTEQAAIIGNGASRVIEMPTEELELSIRVYNCLMRGNVRSVGELLNRLDIDINKLLALDKQKAVRMITKLKIRNIGWKCAEEIVDRLHEVFDGNI